MGVYKARIAEIEKELREFKHENAQLLKKKDETQCIAKSEYVKLEQAVKEKDRDLLRLQKYVDQIKNEMR